MPFLETYYLIDFENVNEDGLSGSENLGIHDHVYLFSTKNAPKISIEKLTSFNSADLSSHEVPVGNQSLDMHLVSYLGYLIGKNENNKFKYIIISKDTGYDNIISFWKTHSGLDITRRNRIAATQEKLPAKTTRSKKSNNNYKEKKTTITSTSKTKSQLNTEVQRVISKAGYDQTIISATASIVVKCYGKNQFADQVKKELSNTYSNYADVYEIIKPVIIKYSTSQTSNTNMTTQLNSKIQKLLSGAGFANDIINPIASLVSRHYKEKNGKQTIYSAIIAKYGQKRGLNIYNHIKNSF